ncbi:MAG: hypothetical protein EWV50_21585 [Microcystis aeruginosa Ma_MB_F_20061100_S20]|uniref:Uncharacterized protein n=1 Tax=Microcystis aeruginosa Ma_MB_F_20061100_S20D TaxID=2486253 RepID=A0A552EHH6_MICAE|nr:MAG: hypothetical protein EWV50_21585 [Microcystis aeruginosa Ma_MB_F_20061100_S20]TRU33948.1 MAG: hypothetical protein EWV78_14305 [Microcystis aeruginosa Ma_MB_F_20061100_S20D]
MLPSTGLNQLSVISNQLSVISYQWSVIRFKFSVNSIKSQVGSFLFKDYCLLLTDKSKKILSPDSYLLTPIS